MQRQHSHSYVVRGKRAIICSSRSLPKRLHGSSTADKLFPKLRRLEVPLLCPLCGGPEDHLHPFVCPSNMVATTAMTAKIRSHLRTLCAWIGSSGVASVTHSMRLRTLPDHAHFFDFNARLSDPAHDRTEVFLASCPTASGRPYCPMPPPLHRRR